MAVKKEVPKVVVAFGVYLNAGPREFSAAGFCGFVDLIATHIWSIKTH
jgi:hypothetical protein